MFFEINKIYTFKEIFELSKTFSDIKKQINLHNIKITKKKKIDSFEDFDLETQNIYLNIAQEIKINNINQNDLFVGATGSRIKGNWKTKEESEQIAKNLNSNNIKYSDYDFTTNAKNIPDLEKIAKKLNIYKIDFYLNPKSYIEIPLI